MGIFTRFKDIINSNINSMLDKAEDPEKMVKLMIREMEDTLVELKASCAGVMASRAKTQRSLDESQSRSAQWSDKARLAVTKGREDLAREALREKSAYQERAEAFNQEIESFNELIERYRKDIGALEEKLRSARDKQRVLAQRHIQAQKSHRANSEIRKYETKEAMLRFEQFEQRIDRMEAEADLVNYRGKTTKAAPSLEEEFERLEKDDSIENELQALKAEVESGKSEDASSRT
jgi:phage shock protein A